jgi:methionine--tRNA ligase beta chain
MARVARILGIVGVDDSKFTSSLANENSVLKEKLEISKSTFAVPNDLAGEISQWLSFSMNLDTDKINTLDGMLLSRSYLVGQAISLADVVVFDALATCTLTWENCSQIRRWYRHISSLLGNSVPKTHCKSFLVPAALPLPPFKATVASSSGAGGNTANSSAPAASSKSGKDEKSEKPLTPKAPSAEPAAAAAAAPDLDPSLLDFRVGKIVKCWNHSDSEKLLCEEVDLGEGSNRQIASGIRGHYEAEDMVGKLVLVLANLKDRNIAGFKSQGMVLCACNEDHTSVKLLTPPAAASPGQRVLFKGFSSAPASGSQVAKKKILEKLAPGLKTDSSGVATWDGVNMELEGAGSVTADLPNSQIS